MFLLFAVRRVSLCCFWGTQCCRMANKFGENMHGYSSRSSNICIWNSFECERPRERERAETRANQIKSKSMAEKLSCWVCSTSRLAANIDEKRVLRNKVNETFMLAGEGRRCMAMEDMIAPIAYPSRPISCTPYPPRTFTDFVCFLALAVRFPLAL